MHTYKGKGRITGYFKRIYYQFGLLQSPPPPAIQKLFLGFHTQCFYLPCVNKKLLFVLSAYFNSSLAVVHLRWSSVMDR